MSEKEVPLRGEYKLYYVEYNLMTGRGENKKNTVCLAPSREFAEMIPKLIEPEQKFNNTEIVEYLATSDSDLKEGSLSENIVKPVEAINDKLERVTQQIKTEKKLKRKHNSIFWYEDYPVNSRKKFPYTGKRLDVLQDYKQKLNDMKDELK